MALLTDSFHIWLFSLVTVIRIYSLLTIGPQSPIINTADLAIFSRRSTMRYEDWDVLLFPVNEDSKVPIKEFKVACHVVHDVGESPLRRILGLEALLALPVRPDKPMFNRIRALLSISRYSYALLFRAKSGSWNAIPGLDALLEPSDHLAIHAILHEFHRLCHVSSAPLH